MKNNKGFSLVELIVVIAIMAILASVAVIGVSVYVPKAQKAADEQMVADVQKAVDLYANMESVQPGQSGYIVIHKDKGTGEVGNVTVGGTMDAFLTDALEATFGEKYGTELKVSYGEWTGVLTPTDANAIGGSSYINNIDDLLITVDSLTGALKAFYDSNNMAENSQTQANQAVLDVAANTGANVNKDEFINWWTSTNLTTMPYEHDPNPLVIPVSSDSYASIKAHLAAKYARYKAIVLYTECDACNIAFSDMAPFEDMGDGSAQNPDQSAIAALNQAIDNTTNHVMGDGNTPACAKCREKIFAYTTEGRDRAVNDAKAYLAILEQVSDKANQLSGSADFSKGGFYQGALVKDIVQEYVSSVDAYTKAGAIEGDIIITFSVDQEGNVKYKANISDN